MTNKTAAFDIYKNSAAAQISLIRPSYNERGFVERTGGVYIEAALPIGKDPNGNTTYNWNEKISFSLGVNDIALLYTDFTKKLVHEYKGELKTLIFLPGEGAYEGTFRMALTHKMSDGVERRVLVPMTAGETRYFSQLIDHAAPAILGW